MTKTEFGLSLSVSWPLGLPSSEMLLALAEQAETGGFDAIWSGDHVQMYRTQLGHQKGCWR